MLVLDHGGWPVLLVRNKTTRLENLRMRSFTLTGWGRGAPTEARQQLQEEGTRNKSCQVQTTTPETHAPIQATQSPLRILFLISTTPVHYTGPRPPHSQDAYYVAFGHPKYAPEPLSAWPYTDDQTEIGVAFCSGGMYAIVHNNRPSYQARDSAEHSTDDQTTQADSSSWAAS